MPTNKATKLFLILLIVGLVIRIFISNFQYSGDIKNHVVWASSFLSGSYGFFGRHFQGYNDPNYPPLAILLFSVFKYLYQLLLNIFVSINERISIFPSLIVPYWSKENTLFLFLKLPGILADIGISILLYKISVLNKNRYPGFVAMLYLFNPATIYLSSVWGQIEPVVNLFLLWSLYAAITDRASKYKTVSIILYTLAVLTKQTSLWFLPFYLILWVKELDLGSLMKGFVGSATVFFAMYIPFGLGPFFAVKNYISTLNGSSTLVSDAAWNIWYFFLGRYTDDSFKLGDLSVRSISVIVLTILLLALLVYLYKNYSKPNFLRTIFIWSILIFFLQTRVHERHLAPALVYNLSLYGFSYIGALSYCVLSLFHLYNLIYSLGLPFI